MQSLRQTIELLSNTLINQNLVNNTGQELVNLVKSYTKTWDILVKHDEDRLIRPVKLELESDNILNYQESLNAINVLKQELQEQRGSEISNLFGAQKESSILLN